MAEKQEHWAWAKFFNWFLIKEKRIAEFSELKRTPSRKYIYFWKTKIKTAAKSI